VLVSSVPDETNEVLRTRMACDACERICIFQEVLYLVLVLPRGVGVACKFLMKETRFSEPELNVMLDRGHAFRKLVTYC
jgi:hypothetical protein